MTTISSIAILQERFWAFGQLSKDTPVHNAALKIEVTERLAERALKQAVQDLSQRHEILRAYFLIEDGLPVLNLAEPGRISLEQQVVSSLEEAEEHAQKYTHMPFQLEQGLLFRIHHFCLPGQSYLCLVAHRIIADHQSLKLLAGELAELYATRLAGQEPTQEEAVPVLAQGDGRKQKNSKSLLSALREELADSQIEIGLPLKRTRPAIPTYHGNRHIVKIPQQLVENVIPFAKEKEIAVSHIFLAAFQAVLHRYDWDSNFLVGVEIDRRPQPDMIGPYADLVLLPSRLATDDTFGDLVQVSEQQLNKMIARQPAPLTLVAEALQQRLNANQITPCQVAFAQRSTLADIDVAGAKWRFTSMDLTATEFDLEFILTKFDNDDLFQIELVYRDDIYSSQLIERIGRHYLRMLELVLADPNQPVSFVEILNETDKKVLDEWSGYNDDYPLERPIFELFEEQAAIRPTKMAFSQGDIQITYGELNKRANQIARLLQEHGAGPEKVIALSMERSWEWLASAVAIFKSGAAVMLIDPRAPGSFHEMVLNLNLPMLLVTRQDLDIEWPYPAEQVVYLDDSWSEIEKRDGNNLNVKVDKDNLAVIFLTSGSTGTPKTVGHTHRGLTHVGVSKADVWRVDPETRTSWLTPVGFGVAVVQIWPCLISGASLHTVTPEIVLSPPTLRDWVVQEGITEIFLVPSLAEIMITLPWPKDCALRFMGRGGERVRTWGAKDLPFETLVDYGSSEAMYMSSSLYPWERRLTSVTASDEDRLSPPLLGCPWPGVHVYILDDDQDLMPQGAIGEICVNSPEVARGYLNDPALTALKFVPNPYGEPGSRLYRTGDLGCQNEAGILKHHGRVDTQLKVRGHRIEAAEVEKTLLDHPQVTDAVVVTAPDPEGQPRLVAYLTMRGQVSTADLRAFTGDSLPNYKVPSTYVPMDRLPRNLNNKVDRRALPPPSWDSIMERQPYQAPRNEVEQSLVALWTEVLRVTNPGINDNFFDLGGDSLSGSRLVMKMREKLDADISLRDLFLSPTPKDLAKQLQKEPASSRRKKLPPIVSRKEKKMLS